MLFLKQKIKKQKLCIDCLKSNFFGEELDFENGYSNNDELTNYF